jgi:hypothetical protein
MLATFYKHIVKGLQDIVNSRGSLKAGDRTWSRAQDCLLRSSQRCLESR